MRLLQHRARTRLRASRRAAEPEVAAQEFAREIARVMATGERATGERPLGRVRWGGGWPYWAPLLRWRTRRDRPSGPVYLESRRAPSEVTGLPGQCTGGGDATVAVPRLLLEGALVEPKRPRTVSPFGGGPRA